MINLIPELKPQIKHSEITQAIDNLQALSEQDEFNRKEFEKLAFCLKERKFYLSQQECEHINQLRDNICEKYTIPKELIVIAQDLQPNEDMNETYYLDE